MVTGNMRNENMKTMGEMMNRKENENEETRVGVGWMGKVKGSMGIIMGGWVRRTSEYEGGGMGDETNMCEHNKHARCVAG